MYRIFGQLQCLKRFTQHSFFFSVAYGVLGFQALGEVVPESASVCQKLQKLAQATTDGGTVNTAYQLAAAAKALTPACTVKLSDKLTQVKAEHNSPI